MIAELLIPDRLPDFGPNPWEARCFQVSDEADSPWLICVTCSWYDIFLARKVVQHKPTPNVLWNVLIEAIVRPEIDEPHRPKQLIVERSDDTWKHLKSNLAKMGIKLVSRKEVDFPDGFPEWCDWEWQKWEKRACK